MRKHHNAWGEKRLTIPQVGKSGGAQALLGCWWTRRHSPATWHNRMAGSNHREHIVRLWLSNFTPMYLPKRNVCPCLCRDMDVNSPISIILHPPELETTPWNTTQPSKGIFMCTTTQMNLKNLMLTAHSRLYAVWFYLHEILKMAKLMWQQITGFLWLSSRGDQPERHRRIPFRTREWFGLWVWVVVTQLPKFIEPYTSNSWILLNVNNDVKKKSKPEADEGSFSWLSQCFLRGVSGPAKTTSLSEIRSFEAHFLSLASEPQIQLTVTDFQWAP